MWRNKAADAGLTLSAMLRNALDAGEKRLKRTVEPRQNAPLNLKAEIGKSIQIAPDFGQRFALIVIGNRPPCLPVAVGPLFKCGAIPKQRIQLVMRRSGHRHAATVSAVKVRCSVNYIIPTSFDERFKS